MIFYDIINPMIEPSIQWSQWMSVAEAPVAALPGDLSGLRQSQWIRDGTGTGHGGGGWRGWRAGDVVRQWGMNDGE